MSLNIGKGWGIELVYIFWNYCYLIVGLVIEWNKIKYVCYFIDVYYYKIMKFKD